MKIHCKYDELVDPRSLKDHPKNRNKHSKEKLERFAKILKYQGWRYAIKVSKQSGFITTGHGRKFTAILKDWELVPVVYQDYESEEQEYADVQADKVIIDRWEKFTGQKAVKLEEKPKDQGSNTDAKMEEGSTVTESQGKAKAPRRHQRT